MENYDPCSPIAVPPMGCLQAAEMSLPTQSIGPPKYARQIKTIFQEMAVCIQHQCPPITSI